jgi:hypothetical protein
MASTAVPATASLTTPVASSAPSATYIPAVAIPPATLAVTWVAATRLATVSSVSRS